MPPQDPYQPSAPPGPGPIDQQGRPASYDFIMNPSASPKRPFSFGSSSKLVYVAVGGIVLVIVLFFLLSLGGNKGLSPSLLSIAQQQTEIARVSGLQYDNLTDDSTKSFALNTELSMQTAQSDYLNFLSTHGSGINSKLLSGAQNPQTDAALTSAQQSGSLDSTVTSTLRGELSHYQQTIKAAYASTHTAPTHRELQKLYDQATLLIQQSGQQD